MTTPKRGPGRPPADDPSVPITFTIPASLAAWIRQMPAGERSKWLAEKVAESRDNSAVKGAHPDNSAS